MAATERQFSELLRQPNEVVAELERHDVLLKRRGQASLRLSLADRDQSRAEAVLSLARMLRVVALSSPSVLSAAIVDAFPWVSFLPESACERFGAALTRALVASADLESFAEVQQLLREWRGTAEIYADPELAAELQRPLTGVEDGRSVPKP